MDTVGRRRFLAEQFGTLAIQCIRARDERGAFDHACLACSWAVHALLSPGALVAPELGPFLQAHAEGAELDWAFAVPSDAIGLSL